MRHYPIFKPSECSLEETNGLPISIYGAYGHVVYGFWFLVEAIEEAIGNMGPADARDSSVTGLCQPFRDRVALMERLILERIPTTRFNTESIPPAELLAELIVCIHQAEEMRNTILRSLETALIPGDCPEDSWRVVEITPEMALEGIRRMGAKELLNVTKFIEFVGMDVHNFFDCGQDGPILAEHQSSVL